jgi:hypothetical protein
MLVGGAQLFGVQNKKALNLRAFRLIRQKRLDNFCGDSNGADQTDCSIEIQPGCP